MPPGHHIILLKSNQFNMAAVSVKKSIRSYLRLNERHETNRNRVKRPTALCLFSAFPCLFASPLFVRVCTFDHGKMIKKKKGKKGERKKEKEKTPTQLPGFELALRRRPAVASMACQKDPSEMSDFLPFWWLCWDRFRKLIGAKKGALFSVIHFFESLCFFWHSA